MEVYKLIGAIGLILISSGLIIKNRKTQNILYILGGVGLEAYSIYIDDVIFIILQILFILAAVYDLARNVFRHNQW